MNLEETTHMFKETDLFQEANSVGERPWGTEVLLALVRGKYSVKYLKINKGNKGGLQYHRMKDEVAVLISGKLMIRYDLGDGILKERIINPGEAVHFPPTLVHQEEALLDCEIIEASTPHFNDRVRVEESYGLGAPTGLQSTNEEDIEIR